MPLVNMGVISEQCRIGSYVIFSLGKGSQDSKSTSNLMQKRHKLSAQLLHNQEHF